MPSTLARAHGRLAVRAAVRGRLADLAGSFPTLALGVAGVTTTLLVLASSATAHGPRHGRRARRAGHHQRPGRYRGRNTAAISAADQVPAWRALRSAGATPARVRRTAATEAGPTVALGVLLGLTTTAPTLPSLWTALALPVDVGPIAMPWTAIAPAAGSATVAGPAVAPTAHRTVAPPHTR
ncbi:hypothetical protein ACFRCG_27340 [Embleya sp. NPDC056575]|uniref:hypothetical protein n=1 Tax=unclassified Embleya TaxID=2699296 RepID=UPI00368DBCB9